MFFSPLRSLFVGGGGWSLLFFFFQIIFLSVYVCLFFTLPNCTYAFNQYFTVLELLHSEALHSLNPEELRETGREGGVGGRRKLLREQIGDSGQRGARGRAAPSCSAHHSHSKTN